MTDRMMGSLARDLGERWGRSYETLIGHILGLTINIRMNQCNMIVASNNISKSTEPLFYTLNHDSIRQRIA